MKTLIDRYSEIVVQYITDAKAFSDDWEMSFDADDNQAEVMFQLKAGGFVASVAIEYSKVIDNPKLASHNITRRWAYLIRQHAKSSG